MFLRMAQFMEQNAAFNAYNFSLFSLHPVNYTLAGVAIVPELPERPVLPKGDAVPVLAIDQHQPVSQPLLGQRRPVVRLLVHD